MSRPDHSAFDELLQKMEERAKVSSNVLARVLVRMMISSPREVTRAEIVDGRMLSKPSTLNQAGVSRAVECLEHENFVTELGKRNDSRSGRPVMPLNLGSPERALMGIKIVHDTDRPVRLYGVITEMRVDPDLTCLAELQQDLPAGLTFTSVGEHIHALHDALVDALEEPRTLLGVGIEVAAHVREGVVVGATHVGLSKEDEHDLRSDIQCRLGLPVEIDNDVNVLAVRHAYTPGADRHTAVIAVLEDGVGASLIIDGHVYRGGGGMAAEPGHILAVPVSATSSSGSKTAAPKAGFAAPCHCGVAGHVDCFAVPRRLSAETGHSLAVAGRRHARVAGELTHEGAAFRRGGEALGQGIASIVNVVNPTRVLLLLPPELARADEPLREIFSTDDPKEDVGEAEPGTAAAEYLEGVEAALTEFSFSRGARDARGGRRRLSVEVLPRSEIEKVGAICAAARVLDAFVMHARERDSCYTVGIDGTAPAGSTST